MGEEGEGPKEGVSWKQHFKEIYTDLTRKRRSHKIDTKDCDLSQITSVLFALPSPGDSAAFKPQMKRIKNQQKRNVCYIQ